MAIGPGKYDELCTLVRERAGITERGGVFVIVIGGNKGNGFSVQADPITTMIAADLLEHIANQIRSDVQGEK